jgi:hypothetical protein
MWKRALVQCVQFSRREYADSLVLQVCGSLLLMNVWAIVQTECDLCVVRWTDAMLSGPTAFPYRGGGERRSRCVAYRSRGLGGGRQK